MIALLTVALAAAPHVVLDAGALQLEVHVAPSAQLFHIVDQISAWQIHCHAQYRRLLGPFSTQEEALLARHAALRRAHGYGVLDQTLYTDGDWRAALATAVRAGRLTRAEADTERAVLERLAPRVQPLLERGRPLVDAAAAALVAHAGELAAFAAKAARFTGTRAVRLPLYLVPSGEPAASGGGANGGLLVVEVGGAAESLGTLVHEAWHAFVEGQSAALDVAAARTPGLDRTLLSEGMAYAVSPGLWAGGAVDQLAASVRHDAARVSGDDQRARPYQLYQRLALALRPLLAEALDDPAQSLASFLPRACDVFRAVDSLGAALDARGPQSTFVLGAEVSLVWARAIAQRRNTWGRAHDAAGYQVLAEHAQPGDLVVLLFTRAELVHGLPDGWRDLVPVPLAHVRAEVEAGQSVEADGVRRQWNVILLAAPDAAGLAVLAARSPALAQALPPVPSPAPAQERTKK